jgi:hypothetical protein
VYQELARIIRNSQLTILNGTEGVHEVVAGLVGQGLTILNTLKSSPAITANGSALVKS